jgi:hypothetical protein
LGCTEGLANWNPETNQITTYDKSDGMVTDGFLEYNASLIFEGSNILAEAGIDGIHQIDVKALQKNLISPATHITQVVVLDQEGKNLTTNSTGETSSCPTITTTSLSLSLPPLGSIDKQPDLNIELTTKIG